MKAMILTIELSGGVKMFYKFLDKEKADELVALGFECQTDNVNGHEVYSFFATDDLNKYLLSNFSKEDYFIDNILRF